MDATLKVQSQIKQNAEEISSYLTDLSRWEKTMNKRSGGNDGGARKTAPPIRGAGTVKVAQTTVTPHPNNRESSKQSTAARHTYDIGYQKWEQFDVDAALDDDDDDNRRRVGAVDDDEEKVNEIDDSLAAMKLTPGNMVNRYGPRKSFKIKAPQMTAVPAARGFASDKDAETAERERGNIEFQSGNFSAAVKSYTKCLGLKAKNYVAFSNRAMAYLKLKEYSKAELDCSCALSIEPGHVKSLSRRAIARNALGKHRAALSDLLIAANIEPSNKQIRVEMQKTRELLRSAVNRAPLVRIPVVLSPILSAGSGDGGAVVSVLGPELPPPPTSC